MDDVRNNFIFRDSKATEFEWYGEANFEWAELLNTSWSIHCIWFEWNHETKYSEQQAKLLTFNHRARFVYEAQESNKSINKMNLKAYYKATNKTRQVNTPIVLNKVAKNTRYTDIHATQGFLTRLNH